MVVWSPGMDGNPEDDLLPTAIEQPPSIDAEGPEGSAARLTRGARAAARLACESSLAPGGNRACGARAPRRAPKAACAAAAGVVTGAGREEQEKGEGSQGCPCHAQTLGAERPPALRIFCSSLLGFDRARPWDGRRRGLLQVDFGWGAEGASEDPVELSVGAEA